MRPQKHKVILIAILLQLQYSYWATPLTSVYYIKPSLILLEEEQFFHEREREKEWVCVCVWGGVSLVRLSQSTGFLHCYTTLTL